jgi:hypothetical protein
MKELTDLLHLLMCQHVHETDMLKLTERIQSKCYYYLEADIAGSDELPDHQEWQDITTRFVASMNFSNKEETLRFVRESILLSQEIRSLTENQSMRVDFILTLLK